MPTRFPSYWFSISLLIVAAIAMAIQGTWGIDVAHHWAFIAVMVVMMIALGWQAYRHDNCAAGVLSHGGLALLLLAVMAGVPWNENGTIVVDQVSPVRIAYTTKGEPMALGLELMMEDFRIERYEDNQGVKQYRSTLRVKGLTSRDTTTQMLETSVNHPARYHGYRLYQEGYDLKGMQYTVIKVVKEPLMPLIYIAMALMAIGAVLQIRDHWQQQKRWLIWISIGLAVLFTVLSVMRIHFGHLMPALRSGWFLPHLACYMIAYSMLAIALIFSTFNFTKLSTTFNFQLSTFNLLHTASSLLLLGMLCGAVWAKQAWGDYWTWDAKECWAAATWLLSLAAIHSGSTKKGRHVVQIVMMVLCFAAMQITWYGVNHLPSAKESLHTYNK